MPAHPLVTRRHSLGLLGASALLWHRMGWGAAAWPPSMALTYQINGQSGAVPYRAQGTLHWQHGNGRYLARLQVKVLWLSREQTSQGVLGDWAPKPQRFTDSKGQGAQARFDPALGTVQYSHGGQAPWQPAMQDEISLYLALAMAQQRHPGQPWQGWVSSARAASLWEFDALAPSTESTPSGTWQTQPMRRLPRHDGDTLATLWLAPQLHGLPVRVQLQDAQGDRVDQRLLRHTPLPALGA